MFKFLCALVSRYLQHHCNGGLLCHHVPAVSHYAGRRCWTIAVDLFRRDVKYEDYQYTPEGIRQLLADYLKLETEGLYGNLPAIILRLDLSQTFKHLSPRHKYVLWHYFLAGYTQAEIGNWLGVSQRMVSEYIDQVCKRIACLLEGGMQNDTTGN